MIQKYLRNAALYYDLHFCIERIAACVLLQNLSKLLLSHRVVQLSNATNNLTFETFHKSLTFHDYTDECHGMESGQRTSFNTDLESVFGQVRNLNF